MKFTSLVLSILLVFSAIFIPSDIYAYDGINYSFNGDVTNSVPEYINSGFKNYYIKEYKAGDKGLCLMVTKKEKELTIDHSLKATAVISFDIMGIGNVEGGVSLVSGTTYVPVISFAPGGIIRSYDGKDISGIPRGNTVNIAIAVDMANMAIDTYANDRLIFEDAYIPSIKLTEYKQISFKFSSDDNGAEIILDNINIHTGSSPLKSYPKASYNTMETELEIIAENESSVIYNFNFDNNGGPATIDAKRDYVLAGLENEDPQNYAMYMESKPGGGGGYFRMLVSGRDHDQIIYQFKLKPVSDNNKASLACIRTEETVNPKWIFLLKIRGDNRLLGLNDRELCQIKTGEWSDVILYINMEENSYSVVVNGKTVLGDTSYASVIGSSVEWAMDATVYPADEETSKLFIDNIRMYEGTSLMEFDDTKIENPLEYDSIIKDSKLPETLLADKMALHLGSGVMYANGEKTELSPAPYVEGGNTMMPVRAISEAFNIEVGYDEITKTVSVGEAATMQIGSDILNAYGKEIKMNTPAVIKNGRTFIPLRALAENVLGKNVHYDDKSEVNSGIVLIADGDVSNILNNDNRQTITDFLFYTRPDEEYLLKEYRESKYYGEHPRVLINKDVLAKMKKDIESNPDMQAIAQRVIASADKNLNTKTPEFGLYDGTRMSSAPGSTAMGLGFAYLLTGEQKYVDAAWVLLEGVCKFPNWNPSHYLDVAEMSAGVALAYDWMYDAFTPEQRKIIEDGLYKNGVYETMLLQHGIKTGGGWMMAVHNWNSVCNSNTMLAAMALMDIYPDECARHLSINIRSLEYTLKEFAPDGAWEEGPSYLDYFNTYLVKGLDSLQKMYGTDFGLSKTEGMDKMGDFMIYTMMPDGYFNYGDASVEKNYPTEIFYLANRYNNYGLAQSIISKKKNESENMLLLWMDPTLSAKNIDLPLDAYFRGSEVVSMRERFNDDAAAFAAFQGGETNAGHSHLDTGAFIYGADGIRWAVDLGKDNYNLTGYGEYEVGRWKIFRLRGESHNTVTINPAGKGADHVLDSFSEVESLKSSETGAISILDMTDVHGADAKKHRRGYFFTDMRKSLVVRDEISLAKPSDIEWHMYTYANVSVDGNRLTLTQDGKTVYLDLLYTGDGVITTGEAKPAEGRPEVQGQNPNDGVTKIKLSLKANGNVNITAKLTPATAEATPIESYDVPMDSWQLPTGTLPKYPVLTELSVDGVSIENFDPSVKSYELKYLEGTELTPVFGAISDFGTVEIEDSKTYNEPVRIKVTNPENEKIFAEYTVNYKMVPKPMEFTGYKTYPIRSATVSKEPQPENPGPAAYDNDMSTRWSAQGLTGCNFVADLGEVLPVDTFYMATYVGDTRATKFDIELSKDGVNYTKVFDGQTSGNTNDYEKFEFAARDARYVRINFYGNSTGDWNSITELLIAKKGG